MGEILSQAEIDALLAQMSGGGSDGGSEGDGGAAPIIAIEDPRKKPKPYDFHHPSKFNKEQLRSLENIFDNYCRLATSFLTGYLRTSIQLEVANAEQVTYGEFNSTLSAPVILAVMEWGAPLKGSVVVELSADIGYAIIDRILGGPGLAMKKMRDFSEIEKILLERVLNQMMTFLPEPFANIADIRPRIDKIETNPQFVQIIQPSYMTALTTLQIKVGSVEGLMNFCIPHITIEPVVERLNTKYMYATSNDEDMVSHFDDMERLLERAKIPVSAVIGRTRIMVSDFVNLQRGDIIPLDSFTSSDVSVMVGNLLKFYAKPGVNKGRNAIQITSLVEREEKK